jgi:uncharacterized membrane-anchored protein YjiN (DUF445 family)
MSAGGAPLSPVSNEAAGRALRLRRMRAFATALLAVMAAIFVATTWALPHTAWLDPLRAFAEAALIGGLADWFAVTALFRRPLGLPIPHTGVVPARKDDIGRALARFIRDNFLVREAVERRLDRTDLAGRLGAWLDSEANAGRVTHDVAAALDWALRAGDGGELRAALGGTLKQAFNKVPVSSAIATLLEVLTTGTHAQTVIDELVKFARTQLESHRVMIRVRIHERSPWWLPQFVDQEIYDKLMAEVERLLDSIAADPEHPARVELVTRVKSLQQSLAADPKLADKSRALQHDVVAHPAVRAYAHDLWARLAEDLHSALAAPGSELRVGVEQEIRKLGAVLRHDPEVAARLNGWLKQLLLYLVENYRDPLSEIVSETIESWDPIATSKRIEQNIGTDLQFIRVNGTLVGGLVGLLIYLGSRVLGV